MYCNSVSKYLSSLDYFVLSSTVIIRNFFNLTLLVTSAELGHRGARSRVLAVLEIEEGKSYGKFTDASRQTLVGNEIKRKNSFGTGKERDGVEHQYSERPATLERRFTIGGGARNPAVLLRRKSIVDESRHDE